MEVELSPTPLTTAPAEQSFSYQLFAPLSQWLRDNSLTRSQFYAIHPNDQPPTVKFGTKVMIDLQRVPEWRERIVAQGGVRTTRQTPGAVRGRPRKNQAYGELGIEPISQEFDGDEPGGAA